MGFLRRQGIRLIIYLDDILILNVSKVRAETDFKLVVELLQKRGFLLIGISPSRMPLNAWSIWGF